MAHHDAGFRCRLKDVKNALRELKGGNQMQSHHFAVLAFHGIHLVGPPPHAPPTMRTQTRRERLPQEQDPVLRYRVAQSRHQRERSRRWRESKAKRAHDEATRQEGAAITLQNAERGRQSRRRCHSLRIERHAAERDLAVNHALSEIIDRKLWRTIDARARRRVDIVIVKDMSAAAMQRAWKCHKSRKMIYEFKHVLKGWVEQAHMKKELRKSEWKLRIEQRNKEEAARLGAWALRQTWESEEDVMKKRVAAIMKDYRPKKAPIG